MALDILQDSLADRGVPQDGEAFPDPATPYAVVTKRRRPHRPRPLLTAGPNPALTATHAEAPRTPIPYANPEVRRGRSHQPAGANRNAIQASRSSLMARPAIA